MSIYIESKRLAFIHVPKTGGTSIAEWLVKNAPLKHTNKSKSVDWRDYYKSQEAKDFVYEHWKEDFEYFGYERL